MASLVLGGSALPLPCAIYRSCLLILVPTIKLGDAEWLENPPRSWSWPWSCSWFLNSSAHKSQPDFSRTRAGARQQTILRFIFPRDSNFAVRIRCINRTFAQRLPAPVSWVDYESRSSNDLASTEQARIVCLRIGRPIIGVLAVGRLNGGWAGHGWILSPCVPPP
ncbi:hypothetical protein BJY00DRAFT_229980 [Aspergillus carlsbadensis]|nr:hypothetical protein BJY00DRAFT_229980 [Aspergillus carlsbadensis]